MAITIAQDPRLNRDQTTNIDQQLQSAHRTKTRLLDQISETARTGSIKATKDLCRQYLHSRAVKISALARTGYRAETIGQYNRKA